jgi:transglutaminase-like putative cysteine protease
MARPTDTLSLLKDISNGVFTQISYQSRYDEGTQSPIETLDRGWGSCRDFAVLLAEAARRLAWGPHRLRLSVRSRNRPRRVRGFRIYPCLGRDVCPGAGWIAFDPTNRSVGSGNLIPLAVARNIAQVTPVAGTFLGTNVDLLSMEVMVKMESATAQNNSLLAQGGGADIALV